MSDDPRRLKATLLEDASTPEKAEFARMLAEMCETAELQAKGHRCWFFVPTPVECLNFAKYNQPPHYDNCPKCQKGRVVIEVYHGNIGDTWNAVCLRADQGCDFKECVSDMDNY